MSHYTFRGLGLTFPEDAALLERWGVTEDAAYPGAVPAEEHIWHEVTIPARVQVLINPGARGRAFGTNIIVGTQLIVDLLYDVAAGYDSTGALTLAYEAVGVDVVLRGKYVGYDTGVLDANTGDRIALPTSTLVDLDPGTRVYIRSVPYDLVDQTPETYRGRGDQPPTPEPPTPPVVPPPVVPPPVVPPPVIPPPVVAPAPRWTAATKAGIGLGVLALVLVIGAVWTKG